MINTTPQPLYRLERDPVPIVHEAGWATGLVWMGVESPAHKRVQNPDCPVHSRSLYCLCYPMLPNQRVGQHVREHYRMVLNFRVRHLNSVFMPTVQSISATAL